MARYRVTMTRDTTESQDVLVTAQDTAEALFLAHQGVTEEGWKLDEGNNENASHAPYVTNVEEMVAEEQQEPRWVERHSVNCARCGDLVDERDCVSNEAEDGDVCPRCQRNRDEPGTTTPPSHEERLNDEYPE